MQTKALIVLAATIFLTVRGYPYIFGTAVETKGTAKNQKGRGIAGSQTTVHGLDDVSQSIAYAHGTRESNARTQGEAIWTPDIHGANTSADAINTGEGNALADSVSKSFSPSQKYYQEHYAQYINYLNSLFVTYPERRREIIVVMLKYAQLLEENEGRNKNDDSFTPVDLNFNKNGPFEKKREGASLSMKKEPAPGNADFNNSNFMPIGQQTFDYQRARGLGFRPIASTLSGAFRWNNATLHKGESVGATKKGWATTSSNNYGLGRVSHVNSEQNAGAHGINVQSNSKSNIYIIDDSVWHNAQSSGKAEGQLPLAFSSAKGNSHGYGAVTGSTNTSIEDSKAISHSEVKGAPYPPSIDK